jgi:two-component system phosphate regulon sensor histidine kinase PhoR
MLLGIVFLLYAANKERRLNELKSEFIANVSHELKTPLSVVRMFAEMLSTGRVRSEEKRQEYLELIVRESERLSTLIENVLDFSAVERGKQTYEQVETDFAELIERAVETVRYRAEREGVEISLEYDPGLPTVIVDEEAVLLAVINLVDNAIKYGAGTPVEVSVESKQRHVEVGVRDRGPGIPDEDTRRIFERFYRVQRPEGQARGSGIGLSLVKHIAEAHGGRAWAENAEGGGACVRFSVKVLEQARRRQEAPKTAEGAPATDAEGAPSAR